VQKNLLKAVPSGGSMNLSMTFSPATEPLNAGEPDGFIRKPEAVPLKTALNIEKFPRASRKANQQICQSISKGMTCRFA